MGDLSQQSQTFSAAETERFGRLLAERLVPGDVVLISGELGSGKTTLTRGALQALGVSERVTSPTFVLGVLYEGRVGPVAHLDLYRLAGMTDEDPGLLDPYFGERIITFIEWPDAVNGGRSVSVLPATRRPYRIELAHAGGDQRQIALSR